MTNQDTIYGIDRKVVEAVMRKARKERNEAFRAIFRNLFKRAEAQPKQSDGDFKAARLAH